MTTVITSPVANEEKIKDEDLSNDKDTSSLVIDSQEHVCKICLKKFDDCHGLSGHWKAHKEITCEKCREVLVGRKDYNTHMREKHEKHEKNPIVCEICQKKFDSPHGLMGHWKIHKEITCETCEEVLVGRK